ncbi:MAG: hypothetical protein ACF8R7_09400 [Phycisphaerales bacterium JB039]
MFDSPAVLLSSLIIGLAGMGLLIYGKKQSNLKCLAAGAGLCVYPYFVHSLIVMWLVALVCGAGLWFTRQQ